MIAILYNFIIVVFLIMIEMNVHDTTGMGMLLIPEALFFLTISHCGIIFYRLFGKQKENLKKCLWIMLAMVGVNAAAFIIDIILVVVALNLLQHMGLMHT